jgi:hypothetical protein
MGWLKTRPIQPCTRRPQKKKDPSINKKGLWDKKQIEDY